MKWVVIVSVVLLLSACLSLKTNNVTEEIELILIPNVQPGKLETKFDIILKSENFISNPSGYIKSSSSSQLLTFTPLETPLSKTWMATATIIPIDKVDVEVEYFLHGYLKRKSKEEFKADHNVTAGIKLTRIPETPPTTPAVYTIYVLLESKEPILSPSGYGKIRSIDGTHEYVHLLVFSPPSTSVVFGTTWIATITNVATSNELKFAKLEYYIFKKYAYVKEVETKSW